MPTSTTNPPINPNDPNNPNPLPQEPQVPCAVPQEEAPQDEPEDEQELS